MIETIIALGWYWNLVGSPIQLMLVIVWLIQHKIKPELKHKSPAVPSQLIGVRNWRHPP